MYAEQQGWLGQELHLHGKKYEEMATEGQRVGWIEAERLSGVDVRFAVKIWNDSTRRWNTIFTGRDLGEAKSICEGCHPYAAVIPFKVVGHMKTWYDGTALYFNKRARQDNIDAASVA